MSRPGGHQLTHAHLQDGAAQPHSIPHTTLPPTAQANVPALTLAGLQKGQRHHTGQQVGQDMVGDGRVRCKIREQLQQLAGVDRPDRSPTARHHTQLHVTTARWARRSGLRARRPPLTTRTLTAHGDHSNGWRATRGAQTCTENTRHHHSKQTELAQPETTQTPRTRTHHTPTPRHGTTSAAPPVPSSAPNPTHAHAHPSAHTTLPRPGTHHFACPSSTITSTQPYPRPRPPISTHHTPTPRHAPLRLPLQHHY